MQRDDVSQVALHVEYIDYDHPENNIFKVVNQYSVQGQRLRRPDLLIFINGIPVTICEFKSAINEDTTVHDAWEQITIRYTRDIPRLMKYCFLSVISDGANTKLRKYPEKQSEDDYELMREFAIILLNDIMKGRNSLVRREFTALMKNGEEDTIRQIFSNSRDFIKDNEVTLSADQYESLYEAIAYNELEFPKIDKDGRFNADELWDFLVRIAQIFKWSTYESGTLGYKKGGQYVKLGWYRVVLSQWVSGYGLNMIMKEAIRHKKNNPKDAMWDEINREYYDYKDCKEHNNIIIADVLDVIESIILFKLSNYFLKVSNAYKEIRQVHDVPNDWYEFVEYGSTNKKSIMIQKLGFSREAALYILAHESDYVVVMNGELKLKNSLQECRSRAVKADFELVKYNLPELFVD